MELGAKLLGSAPVFVVSSMEKAMAFYVEKLGFELSYEMGEPAYFTILDRDDFSLQLVEASMTDKQVGQSLAYVFSTEVDLLAAEWIAAGVEVSKPENFDHGMREVTLVDPDGNRLNVGAEIQTSK